MGALALLLAVAALGLGATSSAKAATTKPAQGGKPQKPEKPGDGDLAKEAKREAADAAKAKKAKEAADKEAARLAAEAQAREDAKAKAKDKPAEKPKDKPTKPKPPTEKTPKPSPGAVLLKLGVEAAQKALNSLGAKLVVDDLYGPKTAAAWAAEAQRRGLIGDFLRVDKNTANVDKTAYATIYAASVQAQKAREAASAKPAPTPALESRTEPAKPTVPTGYDPSKARSGARALANHLSRTGRTNYDRRLLKQWQTWAALKPDGLYGGKTRGALLYFGGKDAPQPFVKPTETQPYVPPG